MKKKVIKEVWSIALIIFFVFAFRSTFFEPFRIPTGSMIPSLMIGDFILVNKFSYGFKVPYSDMFGEPIYITNFKQPKRGDIVVFKYPKDPSMNYVKRVIGLPGDEVEIINNIVYINGEPIVREQIDGKDLMADMDDKFKIYDLEFFKTKTGEHQHIVQSAKDLPLGYQVIRDVEKFKVPAKNYFCMGDNRDFSADSRYWGFVPEENLKGEAIFVWFSMIFGLDGDPFKVRLHRIGTVVD